MTALIKHDWYVKDCDFASGKSLVSKHHYSKGGSNTFVYMHGLFRRGSDDLLGCAWWLPPTRVACESVNREHWKKVLSLSRLVVCPEVPSGGASFLLGRSIRLVRQKRRFVSLVTYADESQNHTGTIYRATNWTYVGRTGPYPRWVDESGRQVSCKSTFSRTKAEMESLGYVKVGSFYKHKYVIHF